MPRKVRLVAGPSMFYLAGGISNSLQIAMVVANTWVHSGESAAPRRRKLSK